MAPCPPTAIPQILQATERTGGLGQIGLAVAGGGGGGLVGTGEGAQQGARLVERRYDQGLHHPAVSP
jgi:hypothetical protein